MPLRGESRTLAIEESPAGFADATTIRLLGRQTRTMDHLTPASEEATDAGLLTAASSGDQVAFRFFVRRHQGGVFRLLSAIAESHEDAEDALQECFLSAWRHADSFRGGDSARAWLLTVARHALGRLRRRRSGEPAEMDSIETLGVRAGWGRTNDGDVLDRMAERELLERALGRLSPDDREVLILRELEGLSGDEVANLLSISVPAMKSRLHRGRLRLAVEVRELADV